LDKNYIRLNRSAQSLLFGLNFLACKLLILKVLSIFRKQLLEVENELQLLVRRLGAEASAIVAMDTGPERLTVPLLKRERKFYT